MSTITTILGTDQINNSRSVINTNFSNLNTDKLESSTVSAFGATLIDDIDASTARSTLGLGTLATQNGTFSGTSSGTNTGDQTTITGNAGSATVLATPRGIYGNNFDGSAALTQIIASTYGGTGNGFAKLSGPTTSEKTFTLPNASATILTDNASVTVAQGGTGRATGTTAYALIATGTTATGAQQTLANGATTEILVGGGASALPVWTTATGSGSPVRATSPTLVTPLLGTPTSGTLTNCTGLPVSGITASTSTALGVGSIELGHASDTTIARVSAGVISVEGVTVPTISSTNTITNKRISKRVTTATNYTTSTTIDSDSVDIYEITAQAGALLFNNPSGTPTNGQMMMIKMKDNGTARALTYGAQFASLGDTLPTTTTISKWLYVIIQWCSTDSKWYCQYTKTQP